MPAKSLTDRVEHLESRVDRLEQLPQRIDTLQAEMAQFREEVRREFATLRTHMQVLHEDLVARISLIGEGRSRTSPKKR